MIRELTNPFQSPNNFMKISKAEAGCCGPEQKVCRNVLEVSTLGFLIFCVICGDTGKELTHEVDLTSAKDADQLATLLLQAATTMIPEGGLGGKISGSEDCVEVTATETGYKICLDTDINIKGHRTAEEPANVPTTEVTKLCEKIKVCKVQFLVEKGETEYTLSDAEGNEVVLGAYATGETLAADIETGLEGLGVVFETVTSEESSDGTSCIVTVESTEVENILLNGATGADCGCEEKWANPEDGTVYKKLSVALKSSKSYGGKGKIKAKIALVKSKKENEKKKA